MMLGPRASAPRLTPGQAVLGLGLAGLAGGLPLQWALPALASLALLMGMLVVPAVGLYALLVAIPFSPTFGLEDAEFSISAFEPLATLLLLIWLARGAARKTIELPRTALFGGLFCLLCALLIAAPGATSLPLAIKESLKWVLLALAFVFTSVEVREEPQIRRMLAVLFFAGSGQALMGVVQFLAGFGPPTFAIGGFMRAHGNFGQPNPFAGYLGTIFPLALALAAVSHPGRFRLLACVTVVCTGLGIVLSLSRGAWLGLLIALGVMAVVWGPRTRRLVVPTLGVSILVGLLGVLGALPPALATRVTSVTSNFGIFDVREVELTSENFAVVERMAHWQAGWEMFLDHPLRGVGPGNYPAVYDEYSLPGWPEPLGHAHNYYLNMAAEAGLPGLLALVAMLALAFGTLLRQVGGRWYVAYGETFPPPTTYRLPPTAFRRALAVGLLGSLVVFSAHNLFDNLLVHGVGIQIGVLLGLIGGVASR
jgi:putative inorganic carbon (hco3(-)) transporter